MSRGLLSIRRRIAWASAAHPGRSDSRAPWSDRRILTRPNSRATLPGCTRRALLRLCADHGLTVEERAFTPEEAQGAVETFQTSASSLVTPVVRIGAVRIGDGRPGPLTRALQAYYLETAGVPTVTHN